MFCIICYYFVKAADHFGFLFFFDTFPSSILLLTTAAGKSTFVNILTQVCEDWEVVPEPVARWCNVQSTQDEFEVSK